MRVFTRKNKNIVSKELLTAECLLIKSRRKMQKPFNCTFKLQLRKNACNSIAVRAAIAERARE